MIGNILLTLFLVLLNGFFVAAEFAIVKVRTSQIQVRTQENLAARVAESIISNLDGYLAATQLGITLASLGLGWIGEGVVAEIILAIMHGLGAELSAEAAHQIALPASFALITILHIVFGELAPKSIAIRFPTPATLITALPLRAFYFVFAWPIKLLNGIANAFLKLIGIQPVPHSEIHSEEELKLIIAESAEGGAIQSSERELIQNVFDFDDRLVRQVLKPRTQITALNVSTPLGQAIETALAEGYSRLPVYEESIDNIFGFVTTKDMLAAAYREEETNLRQLARPIVFTPVTRKVVSLLRQFQRERAQLAVVVSEFGGTVGLVTMEDILEEIVGDINDDPDNSDEANTHIRSMNSEEGVFYVAGSCPIADFNEYFGKLIPESDSYNSVAGFVIEVNGRFPEVGETTQLGPHTFELIKRVRQQLVTFRFQTSREESPPEQEHEEAQYGQNPPQ